MAARASFCLGSVNDPEIIRDYSVFHRNIEVTSYETFLTRNINISDCLFHNTLQSVTLW